MINVIILVLLSWLLIFLFQRISFGSIFDLNLLSLSCFFGDNSSRVLRLCRKTGMFCRYPVKLSLVMRHLPRIVLISRLELLLIIHFTLFRTRISYLLGLGRD
jgi:hypothetical protein